MNNIMFGTPLWVLDLAGLLDNDALEREGIVYQGGNYFDLQTENVLKLKMKIPTLLMSSNRLAELK